MPKTKPSTSVMLRMFVKNYEDFSTDGTILFCKCCETNIAATKKFQVDQHVKTTKHQINKNRKGTSFKQSLITSTINNTEVSLTRRAIFNQDLCNAMILADIPLGKLCNEHFVKFLEKYTKENIPGESTLRKNYVSRLYTETLMKLREKAKKQYIWVSLDETTDVDSRYVANFIFGILGVEEECGKSYLLTMKVLTETNHSTIAAFFNDSLNLLWPEGISYEKVQLVCTDAATYMCKAMVGLQVLYPKMIHVTCLAHGLHRVAELVRSEYAQVNSLISSIKKVFLKAPSRVALFRNTAGPGVPLPPSPIVTRWGSWIEAATYYAENFETVQATVEKLDPDEAQCIKSAQDALKQKTIKEDLIFIHTNLKCITEAISKLETKGLKLVDSVNLVEEVYSKLSRLKNKKFGAKMNCVLQKNCGYQQLKNIADVLQHNTELNEESNVLTVKEIANLKYAPIVSCDVERNFSIYKNVLASNRRSFLFENLMQHMVIKCNALI